MEDVVDPLAICTEYFLETPNGRMRLHMPNVLQRKEQLRRCKIIESALNRDLNDKSESSCGAV